MNLDLRVTIGDLAETVRGVTYEKAEARNSPRQGFSPLIRATNIDHGALVLDSFVYVPDSVIRDDQRLRLGDIVLAASSGSLSVVGKAALLRNEWQGTFGAFCYAVRPQLDRAVPDYLAYFMQTSTYRGRVSQLAAGVNINNLRREHIESLEVPYCGLSEQRRIVEAVDSFLTRLDDAVASLERVQTKLKAYRASVLKAAVEGRLVPTEASLARTEKRPFEPAEALLGRILKERRCRWEEAELARLQGIGKTPKDDKWKAKYQEPAAPNTSTLSNLPEGWLWASPGQLSSADPYSLGIGPFGSNLKVSDYTAEGAPLVFVRNIRAETFEDHDAQYISAKKATELRPHHVLPGDILITKMGDPPGDCCLYPLSRPVGVITADCIKLRLNPNIPSVGFFVYAIRSGLVQSQIQTMTKGVAQKKVSLARFRQLALPLPPATEQQRIADKVETLLSVANQTMFEIDKNLRRCARLRQAILKWAFEGKLVDQDSSEEHAEGLLARTTQRSVVAPKKKSRGRRPKKTV